MVGKTRRAPLAVFRKEWAFLSLKGLNGLNPQKGVTSGCTRCCQREKFALEGLRGGGEWLLFMDEQQATTMSFIQTIIYDPFIKNSTSHDLTRGDHGEKKNVNSSSALMGLLGRGKSGKRAGWKSEVGVPTRKHISNILKENLGVGMRKLLLSSNVVMALHSNTSNKQTSLLLNGPQWIKDDFGGFKHILKLKLGRLREDSEVSARLPLELFHSFIQPCKESTMSFTCCLVLKLLPSVFWKWQKWEQNKQKRDWHLPPCHHMSQLDHRGFFWPLPLCPAHRAAILTASGRSLCSWSDCRPSWLNENRQRAFAKHTVGRGSHFAAAAVTALSELGRSAAGF